MKPAQTARWLAPFAIASVFFLALLALLERAGLRANAGTFVYPLDDAYIHLAISRNLALHGFWGVSATGFSGASSSPLWTLLLATVLRVTGVHVATPLILNTLAALALLAAASVLLARALPRSGTLYRTTVLLSLVLITPLPGLAAIGMEHVLHACAMLCLLALASAVALERSRVQSPTLAAALVITAAVCGALRYESCFGIFAVALLLLAQRRIVLAIAVLAAAAIGPAAYGLYSYRQSGLWLPFSVLMKSAARGGTHNAFGAMLTSSASPILLIVSTLALLVYARSRTLRTPALTFAVVTIATIALSLAFGPEGWLMRYESYLYVLGTASAAMLLYDVLWPPAGTRQSAFALAAVAIALLPQFAQLIRRATHGWTDVAASMRDRYVEHLGQALFIGQEYPHATVVANDIGFLAFYAPNARILDPLGLGSVDPVRLQRAHGRMDPQFMHDWAARENATVAILHTDFPGMSAIIPAGWVPVESWCFPHNLVFQNHVEAFYAPDLQAAAQLRRRLAQFHVLSPEIARLRHPQDGKAPPNPPRGEWSVCPAP